MDQFNTTYSTYTGTIPDFSIEQLRETLNKHKREYDAFVAKHGHGPIREIRSLPYLRNFDDIIVDDGIAFVSEDIFLSLETGARFDAWMARLEASKSANA